MHIVAVMPRKLSRKYFAHAIYSFGNPLNGILGQLVSPWIFIILTATLNRYCSVDYSELLQVLMYRPRIRPRVNDVGC